MKNILIVIVVVIIAGGAWYLITDKTQVIEITENVTKTELFTVQEDERIVLKDDAILTVLGGMVVHGEITGNESVNIVVKSDVTFEESSVLSSGGNIQIVGSEDELLKTDEEVNEAFDEAGEDSGEGPRLGPIVPSEEDVVSYGTFDTLLARGAYLITKNTEVAYADEEEEIPDTFISLRGKIDLSKADSEDEKKRKRLIIISFPPSEGKVKIQLKNLTLIGPQNTPNGTDDKGASCNAKGGDGSDGLRLRARAWGIDINNVTIGLTKGGNGGSAETKDDCDPGIAKGGKGGQSGNLKFTASNNFTISGAFNINPGKSGDGGEAVAFGKVGDPGAKGGDAKATGGTAGDNNKELAVSGTVTGLGNVSIGKIEAGMGGHAYAGGGDGGAGDGCGKNGGAGGKATATGGKGGDASLSMQGEKATFGDFGGDGGDATADGGFGGNGGACDAKGDGGDGGDGGSGDATGGKGGSGSSESGEEGIEDSVGGNGGDGGDGCMPDSGGTGGDGDIQGEDGKDGKNLCVVEKKKTHIKVGDDVTPVKTKMSFAHVKPGEYSEVYMDIEGKPETSVSASLTGPAVEIPNASGTIGGDGKVRLTWRIYQFGNYSASGAVGGAPISGSVSVQ